MNKETYTKWTEDTGVIIADEDLIDLIVVANLFIAWNVSTTILKGVTAGTPILTTDWGAGTQSVVPELMKFDEDYNDCFWSVLSSLMENESKFNERQIAIQNIKSEFSLGDGKCAERIVTELLDNTSLSNQSQGNYD